MTQHSQGKDKPEKTVLVVDDEGGIRRVVSRLCQRAGVSRVIEASNVRAAIGLLDRNHVDLVISDMNMPDESGIVLVQAVKTSKKKTLVMIFSGSAGKADQKRARDAGADVVLNKSPDLAELESAVRRMLHLEKVDKPPEK